MLFSLSASFSNCSTTSAFQKNLDWEVFEALEKPKILLNVLYEPAATGKVPPPSQNECSLLESLIEVSH